VSLKIIESGTIRKPWYDFIFCIATIAASLALSETLDQRQIMA